MIPFHQTDIGNRQMSSVVHSAQVSQAVSEANPDKLRKIIESMGSNPSVDGADTTPNLINALITAQHYVDKAQPGNALGNVIAQQLKSLGFH
jgi:hypothetical protein